MESTSFYQAWKQLFVGMLMSIVSWGSGSQYFFFVALHLKNDTHLCNTLSWEYQNFSYVKIKKHT